MCRLGTASQVKAVGVLRLLKSPTDKSNREVGRGQRDEIRSQGPRIRFLGDIRGWQT